MNGMTFLKRVEMMHPNKRKHERCTGNTAIMYGFFNRQTRYLGVAKDFSKYGMYFVTDRPLTAGAMIVIRPLDCNASNKRWNSQTGKDLASVYCSGGMPMSEGCKKLEAVVVAEVKRCEKKENSDPFNYGIGVHYVGPAV